MNVYLETLGCQMNRLDSELVMAQLRAGGHEMVDDAADAEVVLYNTCSVRDHAEQKVLSRLGAHGQQKAAGKRLIVGVLGCMAQRLGRQIRRSAPSVDIICAPGQLARLPQMIDAAAEGQLAIAIDPDRVEHPNATGEENIDWLDMARDADETTSPSQAFIRVMRGCNKFCTYCIVPFVRGPEISRPADHIEAEARKLIDAGKTEITLLGQTVNRYRYETDGHAVRFSDLLGRLADIDGLRRLRFVTSHPVDFTDDILETMAALPAVCEYIHCPAQSGSDAMLKAMNRGYTRAEYDDFVDRARSIVPGIVLASDFIAGFPGESEEDHAASVDLIHRSAFKNSFLFKYSTRPGTPAAKRFADDITPEIKKRRHAELLAAQNVESLAHHQAMIGQQVEVLAEGPSPRAAKQPTPAPAGQTQLVGRTRGDHIVVFDAPESMVGEYVPVEIVDATALALMGKATKA
jgi:tRNA-2-methylthio-N6-dimethylallyladenosine synthase